MQVQGQLWGDNGQVNRKGQRPAAWSIDILITLRNHDKFVIRILFIERLLYHIFANKFCDKQFMLRPLQHKTLVITYFKAKQKASTTWSNYSMLRYYITELIKNMSHLDSKIGKILPSVSKLR